MSAEDTTKTEAYVHDPVKALLNAAKAHHATLVAPGSHNEYIDCCRLSRAIADMEVLP